MAKKEVCEQKANLYLLAIVAIVAVVGIVVLVLNSGGLSVSTDDLSGQAVASTAKATTKTAAKTTEVATPKTATKTTIAPKTVKITKESIRDYLKKLNALWFITEYDPEEDSVYIPSIRTTFVMDAVCTEEYYWYSTETDTLCLGKSRGDAYLNLDPDLENRDHDWIWFNLCCSSGTSTILVSVPPSEGRDYSGCSSEEYMYGSGNQFEVGDCTYSCTMNAYSGGVILLSNGKDQCQNDVEEVKDACLTSAYEEYGKCVDETNEKVDLNEIKTQADYNAEIDECIKKESTAEEECWETYNDNLAACQSSSEEAGCEEE